MIDNVNIVSTKYKIFNHIDIKQIDIEKEEGV